MDWAGNGVQAQVKDTSALITMPKKGATAKQCLPIVYIAVLRQCKWQSWGGFSLNKQMD